MITLPPDAGLVYRITIVPPDSDWDRSLGYQDFRGALKGSLPSGEDGGIPGLFVTETLDIVTVVSGEIYAVLETGETLLRPEDTLVQRGTKHAWSNRGVTPATIAA
ncbi:hypothetical protein [Geodermatophilus sp. CPCC 205506]|uniref:hypothetical protein n=1 Tax=Geodermatophilus sp. CPCC 205506 TaxID=2936596 RepID=UPI003EED7DEA